MSSFDVRAAPQVRKALLCAGATVLAALVVDRPWQEGLATFQACARGEDPGGPGPRPTDVLPGTTPRKAHLGDAAGDDVASILPSWASTGTTYYVDKNATFGCSDGFPGTPARPWCTIGRAAGVLKSGDTVVVKPGVYHEAVVPPAGGPSGYVTYQGQAGAVLEGTGVAGPAFDVLNVSFVRISGFEVRGYEKPRPAGNSINIRGKSHHVALSNLSVHHNWNGIIIQDDAHRISIADSEVHHSAYGVGFEGSAHEISIDNVASHHNSELLRGRPIHPSYPNGDGFSADSGTYDITITNSIAHDNEDGGFDLASKAATCSSCAAHRNRYGFRLWQGDAGTLANCVASGNTWYPLQIGSNSGAGTKYIFNSTWLNRADDKGFAVEVVGQVNVVMRNNIFVDYLHGIFSARLASLDEDYDLFHSPGRPLGFVMGAHSLAGDPLFVDKASGNLHLQAASPAIDRGVPLRSVATDLDHAACPQGASPDIGAHEYVPRAPHR